MENYTFFMILTILNLWIIFWFIRYSEKKHRAQHLKNARADCKNVKFPDAPLAKVLRPTIPGVLHQNTTCCLLFSVLSDLTDNRLKKCKVKTDKKQSFFSPIMA